MLKLTFSFQSLQSNLNNATREHPEHLDSMGLSGQGGWDAAIASRKTRQSVLCELCFRDMRKEAQWEVPPLIFFRQTSFTASLYSTVNSKPTGKKKSIAYPKKLKKARISKEMAAAAQRHPRGLAITSRGAPHCPPTPSPPLGRGRARTRGPLTRRPAARLHGGRRPRAPTPAAAAGRYGTAPRDAAQRRSFPGVLSFPCRSSPLCSLAFFFFRIKITVLPPFEVLRCVPLGLKYQQPEQLKLPLAREK